MSDVLNDLAAELDLEVSPGFAARVRSAVDLDRPVARRWPWMVAGLAAAAAVVVVVALYVGRTFRSGEGPGELARAAPAASALPPAPAAVTPAAPIAAASVRRVAPAVDVGSAATEEARALDRLLFAIRSGRTRVPAETRAPVDREGLLLAPEPLRIPLLQITPVTISPLPAIEPLNPWEERR